MESQAFEMRNNHVTEGKNILFGISRVQSHDFHT